MSAPTHIPSHTRVEGRIETSSDLEIEGRCDGEIDVAGSVVVRPGAVCKAHIRARSATIQGEIIGSVVCTESILLAAGARVVGDLRAPDVSVSPEAQVDGRVDLLPPAPQENPIRRTPRDSNDAGHDELPETQDAGGIPKAPRPRGRTRVSQRALDTDA